MTAEELNKGKELVVKLLNAIFSSHEGYKIEYRTDETGIIANLVDPDNVIPIVSRNLINQMVWRSFRAASKYLPIAMEVYSNVDIIIEDNGHTLTGYSNDVRLSQPILDCFNSTIEYIENNPTKLRTAFINVSKAMGDYTVTLVNNTVMNSDIDSNDSFLHFYIYVVPDYILLTNKEGQSVKVTLEDIKEFVNHGGEDGEPYWDNEKEVIDSILSSTSFAIQEHVESGTIIPEFYNCLGQYVSWDEGLYEDYFPQLEILINGISQPTVKYGHYKETGSSDFETIEELFNFLNRK